MFLNGQRVSASMVALAHGTSDGQKTMGVITLVLVAAGYQASGTGPAWWVILAAGCAIGLGTYSGGWRIMRTMGKGLCDIESPQGFAAETASTAAIGSGIGRRTEVRWATAGKMVIAWLVTLPAAALVGAITSAIAGASAWGVVIDLVLLAVMAAVIVRQANHHKVDHNNVNDSTQVGVRKGSAIAGGTAA